jgi:alkanesulfonate monooxygenase SsuD/methylene tetrahydromethanopterin reductase-like flavin-dependent oxidoreductase (luciferase family)
MRFSIQLPTCTEGLVNPIPFARPDDFVRLARQAERLGYDAVWGNDHVTAAPYVRAKWSEPPNFYEVLITLATVGAHRARPAGHGRVALLPAIRCCSLQVATLDQLTGGRLCRRRHRRHREEFSSLAAPRVGATG